MNKELRALVGMLGIAKKSGRLKCGSDAALELIKKTECTVFVAADASERTKKLIRDKCEYYKRSCVILPITSEEFAAATGRSGALATAALADASLASAILSRLEQTQI